MKAECIQLAKDLVGNVLNEDDLEYLEASIVKHLKDIPAKGMSRAQRLKLAGEKALQSRIEETTKYLHTNIDEAFKRIEFQKEINSYQAGIHGKTKAVLNNLFFHAGSTTVSLEKKIEVAVNARLASYAPYLKETGKYFGLVHDPAMTLDVFKEMKGVQTGNPVASSFAKHHFKTMKEEHARGSIAGNTFEFRENRIPQPADPYKLQAKGKSAYVNDLYRLVDHSKLKNLDGKPWTEAQFEKRASQSFDAIISKKGKDITGYGGKVGEKRRHTREWEFKDAESHLEYLKNYGTTTHLGDLLTTDLKSLVKDNIIAENIGINADSFIRKSIEEAYNSDSQATAGTTGQKTKGILGYGKKNKLDIDREGALVMWDSLKNGQRPDNVVWANWASGMRAMASAILLGKHPIDALLEDGLIVRQMLKRMGISKEEIQTIRNMGHAERNSLISDIALFGEGVIANGNRTGVDSRAYGFASSVSDMVQKASGAHFLDTHSRSQTTLIISNQIGRNVDKYKSLHDLLSSNEPKEIKQAFKSFTPLEFEVLRRSDSTVGPQNLYSIKTPKHIQDIKDADLADLVASSTKEKTGFYEQKIAESGDKLAKEIEASLAKTEGKHLQSLAKADKELIDLGVKLKEAGTEVSRKLEILERDIKTAEKELKEATRLQQSVADRAIERHTKRLSEIDIEEKSIPEQSKKYFAEQEKLQKAIVADIDKTKAKRDNVPQYLSKLQERAPQLVIRKAKYDRAIKKKYAQLQEHNATVAQKEKEFKKKVKTLGKERDRLNADIATQTERRDVIPSKALAKRNKLFATLEETKSPTYRSGRQESLSADYAHKYSEVEKLKKVLADKKQALAEKGKERSEAYVAGLKKSIEEVRFQEAQGLKNKVANKVNALISGKVQTALRGATSSSLRDQYRLGLLTYKAGTLQGEALRMLLQFHVTPFGLYFTHMKDLPESGKMPEGSSLNIKNIKGSFAVTTAMAGIGTEVIKTLLRGEDPNAVEAIKKGTLGNGALVPHLNMFMPFLEGKGATSAMGAVPGIASNVASSLTKGIKGKAGIGQTLGETTRHITPFMNMWYTNAPYEHLLYGKMMDWFNPDYTSEKQKRQERRGRSFFWNKDSVFPHRSPTVKGY
ncbi:hypothetical protein [Candidatus Liberibacter sp.]|uniref:hypothetical protein n=1 Tax=Candidatus Liberibacter sp. TaxID=34022 RepID=UPI0015F514E2|nr:hypothetical protein [Candidatus Liberibacter sp.]MBA5724462.1 hypothetical protein [Candidatus Liberibacter sp.]